MLKKLIIIITISFIIIALSSLAWSSVEGTWEMTGKVTTSVKAKGMKSKTLKGTLDGDSWIFNGDNSFESDNVGGTWGQKKTKFTINFNDDDIISLIEETLSEEFGTDVSVDAVTKKTCSGTENIKKKTIKGTFKIYMNVSGYDQDCECERTGKVTVSGSFTGGKESTVDITGNWEFASQVVSTTCDSFYVGQTKTANMTLTMNGSNVELSSPDVQFGRSETRGQPITGYISGNVLTMIWNEPPKPTDSECPTCTWTVTINGVISSDLRTIQATLQKIGSGGECSTIMTFIGTKL